MSPTCETHGPHGGICWACAEERGAEPVRMADRVAELRAWAKSRIEQCERVIETGSMFVRIVGDAAMERRTLLAVLRILDGKEAPDRT